MDKQKKLLRVIIDAFNEIEFNQDSRINKIIVHRNNSTFIRSRFKLSKNKNDLVRRILNEVVLSNDEIINLLRIIFDKEK